MSLDVKDLISIYFERSDAIQTFWNFLLTVGFALIAFFGSLKAPLTRRRLLAIIFTVAYLGFAGVNIAGILEITKARLAASEHLCKLAFASGDQAAQAIAQTAHPPACWKVVSMHVFADAFILTMIWILANRSERTTSDGISGADGNG